MLEDFAAKELKEGNVYYNPSSRTVSVVKIVGGRTHVRSMRIPIAYDNFPSVTSDWTDMAGKIPLIQLHPPKRPAIPSKQCQHGYGVLREKSTGNVLRHPLTEDPLKAIWVLEPTSGIWMGMQMPTVDPPWGPYSGNKYELVIEEEEERSLSVENVLAAESEEEEAAAEEDTQDQDNRGHENTPREEAAETDGDSEESAETAGSEQEEKESSP